MNLRKTITKCVGLLLDYTVVPVVKYTYLRLTACSHPRSKTVIDVLRDRAAISSADYVEGHMPYALEFPDRFKLLDYSLTKIAVSGIYAEFGVWKGQSINHIANSLNGDTRIYGFDSFQGLREDWRGHDLTKGCFSLDGRLPAVASKVQLIAGWFDETIPPFLKEDPSPFAFIHIDSDTYEACKTVFGLIGERLIPGTVIVFDEYFGNTGWQVGEWKAWQEFVAAHGIRYEYLGFSENQVSVKICS